MTKEEHAKVRAELIAQAHKVARRILRRRVTVTAPMVLSAMREDPKLAAKCDLVDPRWIGAVFTRRNYHPCGYSLGLTGLKIGSHGRPVRVWGAL